MDGRRERYEATSKRVLRTGHKPLPNPWVAAYLLAQRGLSTDWFYESEANQAHGVEDSRVIGELHEAKADIIETGCAREPVQRAAVVMPCLDFSVRLGDRLMNLGSGGPGNCLLDLNFSTLRDASTLRGRKPATWLIR